MLFDEVFRPGSNAQVTIYRNNEKGTPLTGQYVSAGPYGVIIMKDNSPHFVPWTSIGYMRPGNL